MARVSDNEIPLRPDDLSAYARIRNAAMEGFAAKGVAATSIRDVAATAGVSPGLVQHHFGNKAGLQAAVDDYVVTAAAETFRDLVPEGDSADVWTAMGDAVTAWVDDNAIALRYVARALAEGDAAALEIFDALVEIARTSWLAPLARGGMLDAHVDEDWAAMHAVMFNLASVLFEPAINRHLPEAFFSPAQLQRWNSATTQLYRRGVSPASAVPASRTRPRTRE